jgi:hypothetical protein
MQRSGKRRTAGRQELVSQLMKLLLKNPAGVTPRQLTRELPEMFCERVLRQLATRQLVRREADSWVPTPVFLGASQLRLEQPGATRGWLRRPLQLLRSPRTLIPFMALYALCALGGMQRFLSRNMFTPGPLRGGLRLAR